MDAINLHKHADHPVAIGHPVGQTRETWLWCNRCEEAVIKVQDHSLSDDGHQHVGPGAEQPVRSPAA